MPEIPSHNLVEGDLYAVRLSEWGRFSADHDGIVNITKLPTGSSRCFIVEVVSGLEYYLEHHGARFDVGLGSPFHQSMKPLITEEEYSIEFSFDSLMNHETEE